MILLIVLFPYERPLSEVLNAMGTDVHGLGYEKLEWSLYTKDYLPIVRSFMKNPLYAYEWEQEKKRDLKTGVITAYVSCAADQGYKIRMSEKKPDLKRDIEEIRRICDEIKEIYKPVDEKKVERILYAIQKKFTDEDTTQPSPGDIGKEFGFTPDTTIKTPTDTLLKWYRSLNIGKLYSLNAYLISIVYNLSRKLLKNPPDTSFILDTPSGRISVGGHGNNIYEGNYLLIIDTDGDDIYRLKGAVLHKTTPVQIIIDLDGNDTYCDSGYVGPGGAVCGTGIVFDLEGNDNYFSHHISIGAGFMGTGLVFDSTGDDNFRAGIMCCGAGFMGTGILYDRSGSDIYSGFLFSEGFAGVYGEGVLYDGEGNDVYYAGGFYLHKPLLPETYQSLSQGFSIGERPDFGGGIGLLCDGSGNDSYYAGTYAQGTSYWFSAGFLFDDSGEDYYNATEYAQGAGIHLSFGYLHDLAGNDHYFSRHGPSQGEGHDFAVGILIDSAGYDWYTVSGGLGIGLTNSIGIFIDGEGNDVYNITEKRGGTHFGIGDVNKARGFTGIGIFLDLGGKDVYPSERYGDDKTWARSIYGMGMDRNSQEVVPEYEQLPVPELSKMDIRELFELASQWGVGENKDRVKKAREELARRGKESLDYIFREKIRTKSGLEMRAIRAVLKENRAKARDYLLKALKDTSWIVRRNACSFIADIELDDAEDSLIRFMERPENRKIIRSFIYALGRLKSERAREKIEKYLGEEKEDVRITSIEALKNIGDTLSIPSLIPLLNDRFTTVRSACIDALYKFGADITEWVESKWRNYPLILYVGGKVAGENTGEKTDRIKNILFTALDSKDDYTRYMAVLGLSEIKDSAVKTAFQLRVWKEKQPVIRDVMKRYLGL